MDKINQVIEAFRAEYGQPETQGEKDHILSLIKVILSQNTNDKNMERAYSSLLAKFGEPEQIIKAPKEEIADAIQGAGLQNKKAKRIKGSLREIKKQKEELTLDFLDEMPVKEAKKWLMQLPGVGPKSAAVILNFDFNKPTFPVDTHVFRVSKRIGLIPEKVNRKKAHDILENKTPREAMEDFHLNLIKHGREICKAPTPTCSNCFLTDLCDYYINDKGPKK
ncbi:MAG: EndoIII-related endonuclease Nth [Candidatus Methanohalarchaeum thermophilum]|uniref:EndoIII-related endonuclease Nth n=1 Tax=Methanohalarchaeum thermophilum TaxID=1903181 RepID=A0A1Q6DS84_METT1|nr:MAG: EndoIII-related endonuclease Nth [Candidatus Methanohalarchaeum thermophilum]